MSSVSGLNMPIKPTPPVATMSKGASKPSVNAGGGNKLKAKPPVAANNLAAWVKPAVKGGEQKTIAAVSSRKKAIDPGIVVLEKSIKKKVSMSAEKTRQITLTQLPVPIHPKPASPTLTIQQILEHNWCNDISLEAFYTSKKNHRGVVVQYTTQMEAMVHLLDDIRKSEKLSHLPAWMRWLDYLKVNKLDAGLLALCVLCFTMLMGGATDQTLICNLVPVLIRKDFSLKWLTDNSVEFIQSELQEMGHTSEYAKMLQNVAERICWEHNGRVPILFYKLFTLPGVDSRAAGLTLHHALNKINVSTSQWLPMCHFIWITNNPDSTYRILQWTTMSCVGQRCWIGYLLT